VSTLEIFHCSDLHFGHPAVPEQYEAMEDYIHDHRYDVVAISGDFTQRARSGEFQRARAFLKYTEEVSKTICVPGNHDVEWWHAPFGLGYERKLFRKYRRYISDSIEPVLRAPGAVFVGLNTSHGIIRQTLTWNLRDLSVIGYLRDDQLGRAADIFAGAPPGDARIVVMHHNPVKGELSQRHGLRDTHRVLGAFAKMGVDLVLCGHDHQEAVHFIEHTKKGTVISTAGTISNRARGGRPSSVNKIRITSTDIQVHTLIWSDRIRAFLEGPTQRFQR
jgi:3',5'-cyclic AMP phosphodiesterase CpdA